MNRQTMHCPSCGIEISTTLKFCRACGMSLELVSKAMAHHFSTDEPGLPKAETDKRSLQRMIKTMGIGGIILFIGVIILVISKRLLHSEMVELVGGLTLLAGTFIMTYAVFAAMWRGVSTPRHKDDSADPTIQEFARNTSPEGLAAPPPSVTEQTTKILETNLTQNSGKEPNV